MQTNILPPQSRRHLNHNHSRALLIISTGAWLIINIFSVWCHSYLSPITFWLIAALSAISTLVGIVCLRWLIQRGGTASHLWAIFVVLALGYHLKMGVLSYFYVRSGRELYILAGVNATRYLANEETLMKCHAVMAMGIIGFALALLRIAREKSAHSAETLNEKQPPGTTIVVVLISTLICFCLMSYLQVTYVIEAARQGRDVLPFRIGGAIQAFQRSVVPLLFLYAFWLAELRKDIILCIMAVCLFIIYGLAQTAITTSRANIVFVLTSIFAVWYFQRSLTLSKIVGLGLITILCLISSSYIGDVRTLRNQSDLSFNDTLAIQRYITVQSDQTFLEKYLGVFFRAQGAEALLNIVPEDPSFSAAKIIQIANGQISTDRIYGEQVLGMSAEDLSGVAFAPSLYGVFYLFSGSAVAVSVGVFCYTLFWNWVLLKIHGWRIHMRFPLIIVINFLVLFYTSEGTIESMPQAIALTTIGAVIVEYSVRLFSSVGGSGGRTLPAKNNMSTISHANR